MTQVVSEMDVTTGTPVDQAKLIDQGYYYRDAFRIFREHTDDLFAVTLWGLHDARSWRSAGAPLLFDGNLKAKPAYFGAVDGELDARLRSAFVFQGSVPLDADATDALAWQQLPLHRFGDDTVGFQLRWEADHLTAYVEVADATPRPDDAATFVVDDATFVFRRDGSGDVSGVVADEAGGWKAVVHLPLDGAAINDQLPFDVAVTDGAETVGWNDAGAIGTLTLVEPVSFTDVTETATAPVIDGVDRRRVGLRQHGRDRQAGRGQRGSERRRLGPSGRTTRCTSSPTSPTRSSTTPAPTRGSRTPSRSTSTRATSRTARTASTTRRSGSTSTTSRRSGPATRPSRPTASRAPRRSSPTATSSRPRSASSRTAAWARSTVSTSR